MKRNINPVSNSYAFDGGFNSPHGFVESEN